MKIVGYVRVSTPTQAESGEGLGTQKEFINKLVKDRGWTLHRIYADEGISGSKSANRPALQELLQDAKNKDFEAVVISRLSRFGRNARELLNNIHILQQSSVILISIKEQIDLSTPYGRAMVGLLAVIAELEREVITEQMSESKMIKWRENRMFNGKPPYGYRWNKETNTLEIMPEEEEVYKKIVDFYLNYGMSLKDIGIRLKEDGIISKKAPFSSSTLSYILKNSIYYGHYVVNQHKYIDGTRMKQKKDASEHISFPIAPLISRTQWQQIQERTEFNKFKGKRITIASNHWLRDMVFCGECGGRIKPRYGNKRKDGSAPAYYCCYWSQTSKKDLKARGKEKCLLPHIPTEKLEKQIWDRILFHLTIRRDKYFDAHFANKNFEKLVKDKTKQMEKITNEIAKQNRAKENLYMLLQEQGFNKGEFISRLNLIQEEIHKLQQDYKDCENGMQEAKEMTEKIKKIMTFKNEQGIKIREDLQRMSVDDRKKLAENMFEKISISKDKKDSEGFKVSYHKYGPVTVLEQFIQEGKLPSFDSNGFLDSARPLF